MENRRFWIFLALGVLLAMSFRFLDITHRSTGATIWKTDTIAEDASLDGPRHLMHFPKGSHLADRPHAFAPMAAGLTPAQPAVTKAPAAAAKKDDKKKKKKKEAAKPKTGNPFAGQTSTDDKKSSNSSGESDASGGTGGGAGAVASPVSGAKAKTVPQTLQEWEAALLTEPDFQETTLFISMYQSNQVSAGIFYTIIGEMLGDSRAAMQQLGVISLGATPSVESYLVLDNAVSTSTLQSTPRSQALVYLNSYSSLSRLAILESVLESNSSSPAMIEAIQILDKSAKHNLAAAASSTTSSSTVTNTTTATGSTTTATTAANIQKAQKYFTPFLPILQKIAASSKTSSLGKYASQEYTYLATVLANTTAPQTATSTTTSPQAVATQQQEAAL